MKLLIRISRQTDRIYRACCPALPGCIVYGRSKAEAMSKINDAVGGYLGSLDVALPRELNERFVIELIRAAA
ncbi:MAG: type II toxin-antitoxin system HicB family antitoxin [Phycisphaerae bacterium]|nr:type II toxin-antitoxin system HicB family antitoxin [Phycisphaerae bacterium]